MDCDEEDERKKWERCERYEPKWTCEPDRLTRLLFWVWPAASGSPILSTSSPTSLFLLSNTGRFGLFYKRVKDSERVRGGKKGGIDNQVSSPRSYSYGLGKARAKQASAPKSLQPSLLPLCRSRDRILRHCHKWTWMRPSSAIKFV